MAENILQPTEEINGNHFGIPVRNKVYPSCYRYNIIIMLAKRLLKKELQTENKKELFKKLIERIM